MSKPVEKVQVKLPDGRIIQRKLKIQPMGNFIMNIITYKGKEYLCGDGDEYLRGYLVMNLGKCLDDKDCLLLNFDDISVDMKVMYLGEIWTVAEKERKALTIQKGTQRLGIAKSLQERQGCLTKVVLNQYYYEAVSGRFRVYDKTNKIGANYLCIADCGEEWRAKIIVSEMNQGLPYRPNISYKEKEITV
jgi:hypothetical protein